MARPVYLQGGQHVVIQLRHVRRSVCVWQGSSVGDTRTACISGDHHRCGMVSGGYPPDHN